MSLYSPRVLLFLSSCYKSAVYLPWKFMKRISTSLSMKFPINWVQNCCRCHKRRAHTGLEGIKKLRFKIWLKKFRLQLCENPHDDHPQQMTRSLWILPPRKVIRRQAICVQSASLRSPLEMYEEGFHVLLAGFSASYSLTCLSASVTTYVTYCIGK